ncbi:L,D-transpeptidase [Pseudaestuariivita sp.]|uniref:L,D-transpeptidase n=1 Tax=Pseudaestuariivita sp. TaxID=2211669 RepID=UPI004058CA4F
MLNRRTFISTLAASAAAPMVAGAYTVPDAHMPIIVPIKGEFAPGEIHVDPGQFSLYWTMPGNRALRYAVRVGRGDLYEAGEFTIGAKKEWPSWTPTPDMIEREPEKYKQYEDGMPGGPDNPLGARALYLFVPGRGDTFLRIHGTPQPWTIGSAVSNGCVGLVNQHIEHLYNRVPKGTRVVLYPKPPGLG